MKIIIISLFSLVLTACSTVNYKLPKDLAHLADNKILACQFSKQQTNDKTIQQANWYFWKSENRTESRDELSNQGEIWSRNKTGQLTYTRLFYKEQAIVELTTGDLAATGKKATWQELNSLMNPDLLGKELVLIDKSNIDSNAIEYYRGIVNGILTEVDWLVSLKLPARFMKKDAQNSMTLTLNECGDETKFLQKPLSKTEFDNMRRFDYSDLGDMEDDPLVRHLEQLMSGHRHNE